MTQTGGIWDLALNAAVAAITLASWLHMALDRSGSGRILSTRGVASLKYFTVLSNLLSGATAAVAAVAIAQGWAYPTWLVLLKLCATTSVMLTFVTVVTFLGPRLGWKAMFSGANLWLHLVLPLAAAAECCLFVPLEGLAPQATLVALLPTAAYGIGYIGNLVRNGVKKDGRNNDFYGFASWGMGRLPIVAAVMLLVTWGIAFVLFLASGMCQ